MRILLTSFCEFEDEIRAIRNAVFEEEQRVPAEIDWDGNDSKCRHALVLGDAGEPVATGRLAPDGKIGRLAVLNAWRGRGIGTRLLDALVGAARDRGLREVYLHAQTQALNFYEQANFQVRGESFHEAGIEHCYMFRSLSENEEGA